MNEQNKQAVADVPGCRLIVVSEPDAPARINELLERGDGYLALIHEEDTFGTDYFVRLRKLLLKKHTVLACGHKAFVWGEKSIVEKQNLEKGNSGCIPFTTIPEGTLIDLTKVGDVRVNMALEHDWAVDLLLRLTVQGGVAVLPEAEYVYTRPDDSQYQCATCVYDRRWYYDSMEQFLLPLLEDVKKQKGELPVFLQYYAMYALSCRFQANENNRNKHVISEEELPAYLELVRRVLSCLDDAVIANLHDSVQYSKNYQFNRMFLRLKHQTTVMEQDYLRERTTLAICSHGLLIYLLNKMRVNIAFMNFMDGHLEIDATVPDCFDPDQVQYFFQLDDQRFGVVRNERYSLTKYFGQSAYKRFSFHCSIPLEHGKEKQVLQFVVAYQGMEYVVKPEYDSHFSRLANYPTRSYWHFDRFMATRNGTSILIQDYKRGFHFKRELLLWGELLKKHKRNDLIFLLLRMVYFITLPWFRRKPIWMFYDKIYKGGDSSEYLYKYAKAQKDGIRKYYLMDKSAVDYQRLKEEGFKPMKRGSLLHRLVFLNADMMIVSNSTVFAFNNYSMAGSRYVRGITDFHTVCVQHGLSVQKIGLAQQRLRDNTRLYFCASKYEIENLSHPVYDYVGYDALKLTGVPRYDGLVDRDKKQILISPTWRMQSAMLVSKNEGVERDYNPNFKDTDYYKVYNSLINDPRLIEAAERYGYKLIYVLHPIVSPQAKDFDTNPYVEIVPATGKMSYETLFCESSLMVTDFSGVQFDFAYMRKPLVYHHHRDLDAHYEEGTFHYDTMAFGEITHDNEELIDLLCEYMANSCKMKDEYRRRADDFFAYDDHNNCQRIYDIMLDYQHRVVDTSRPKG